MAHHALSAVLTATTALLFVSQQTALAWESKIWGDEGSRFDSRRIMDWSYAGYAAGEAPLPSPAPTVDVRQFGATGNGRTDDTTAFLTAISSTRRGVIRVPAGKYVLTQRLIISERVSLVGDGSGKTILYFPSGLADAPEATQAYVSFLGKNTHSDRYKVADITGDALRGTNTIKVSSTRGVRVGQWVSVTLSSPQTDFLAMNQNVDPGCDAAFCFGQKIAYSHQSRVAGVRADDTIILERPLPWSITGDYPQRSVYRINWYVADVGISGFTFQFGTVKYGGHFKETNRNALQMTRVANTWIKDIEIIDADIGVLVFSSHFVTVDGIKFTATSGRKDTEGFSGHFGLALKVSTNCLATNLEFNTRFIHDMSVDKFANMNVFSQIKGEDVNMDHHKGQNYGNLWTQIDTGAGRRPFDGGGSEGKGLAAGAFTTFWNIRGAASPMPGPEPDFGPWINFIGVDRFSMPGDNRFTTTWYLEGTSAEDLDPPNLHQAQKALRTGTKNQVSSTLGGVGVGGDLLVNLPAE